jgi:hypothetical protein
MNFDKSVITLTFGDQAENHVGMEQLGQMVNVGEGFNKSDFEKIIETFTKLQANIKLYDLAKLSYETNNDETKPEAYLLVIRNGVDIILKDLGLDETEFNHRKMFEEQSLLNVDKKVFMYGRVVNKHARWNLCFDYKSQEPVYENGKGRIISFTDVPITNKLMESFPIYFGEKAKDLKGEGNYYFDKTKCGIGFHGDSERRKVLAVRLGSNLDIHYQWFQNGKPTGKRIIVPLNGGDIYLMCEKAVGTDWKKKKVYTLRHATGCSKYTTIKASE